MRLHRVLRLTLMRLLLGTFAGRSAAFAHPTALERCIVGRATVIDNTGSTSIVERAPTGEETNGGITVSVATHLTLVHTPQR